LVAVIIRQETVNAGTRTVAMGIFMFELGIIGYGSMGSMLLNGFLSSGVLLQEEAIVSTRTRSKLEGMKKRWPKVAIADNNATLARQSKIVLIAVKPKDVKLLLDEIADSLQNYAHLVLISAGVSLQDVEVLFPGKVSKMIPSVTMETGRGVALVCHNDRVSTGDAARVERLFGAISVLKHIEETDFEVAADMTSCAPGFFAAIVQEFVDAGTRHSTISKDAAETMVIMTLYGTAKLLAEKGMGTEELIARVATKGGITEEGVKVLHKDLPATFDNVFSATLKKQEVVKAAIKEQFKN
jgi:pyrroline-5-carboxylate reductase